MDNEERIAALLQEIANSLHNIEQTLAGSTDGRGIIVTEDFSNARWS